MGAARQEEASMIKRNPEHGDVDQEDDTITLDQGDDGFRSGGRLEDMKEFRQVIATLHRQTLHVFMQTSGTVRQNSQ